MAVRGEELEFNLREWGRKAHLPHENLSSRRLSATCIRSFREEQKSCRANFTFSSTTVSSPRYSLKEEIDPSNYSFTSALNALQAKTMYKNWDWLKPEGIELNSKWNEAEKYICNPFSGEVPLECLSSKTLISRSFRNLPAPFIINLDNPRTSMVDHKNKPINPNVRIIHEDPMPPDPVLIQEKKVVGLKRDMGVQSALVEPIPAITPESMKTNVEADDSSVECTIKLKAQQEDVKLEEDNQNMVTKDDHEEKKKKRGSGCLSWMRE